MSNLQFRFLVVMLLELMFRVVVDLLMPLQVMGLKRWILLSLLRERVSLQMPLLLSVRPGRGCVNPIGRLSLKHLLAPLLEGEEFIEDYRWFLLPALPGCDLVFLSVSTMALTFVTVNVDGLRDANKRAGLLHWLSHLSASFVCLQETHFFHLLNVWNDTEGRFVLCEFSYHDLPFVCVASTLLIITLIATTVLSLFAILLIPQCLLY